MPFEPLRTDEPLTGPQEKVRDLDSQMLAGCSCFVGVSLISYALAVWPFFVFQKTWELKTLAFASLFGLVPAAVFGSYTVRKWGLPAAGGFIGGALATAIFLLLRLSQVMLQQGVRDLPQPEFPSSWQYLVPGAWMLAVLILCILLIRKEEISFK
jgi:hypothetical protein